MLSLKVEFKQQPRAYFFVTILGFFFGNPMPLPILVSGRLCLHSTVYPKTAMWQPMRNMRTLRAGPQTYDALCSLVPHLLRRYPRQNERRSKLHLIRPPARHACMSGECQWLYANVVCPSPTQVPAGLCLAFACSSRHAFNQTPAASAS